MCFGCCCFVKAHEVLATTIPTQKIPPCQLVVICQTLHDRMPLNLMTDANFMYVSMLLLALRCYIWQVDVLECSEAC